jgi:hydroxymethylglutaryl-CoA synthase
MIGIVNYGTYIPKSRIKLSEIASVWKKNGESIENSLRLSEKSVPSIDEDAVTVAIESARQCFWNISITPDDIEAIFVGSESHPYAVNPTSTIVGELIGVGKRYIASDMEFACKAGTTAMIALQGLIASKSISYGLAIGADTAQSKPHDALEYTAAAGSVAFLLGSKHIAVEMLSFASYTSDTPDFWRRDGIRYPSHAGRFSGEPAYFAHVFGAGKTLFEKSHIDPKHIDYCVFHMPNGKFPRAAAKALGFTIEQLNPSLTIDAIGNPYSASSMLGLSAVLDCAKPSSTIFFVSYGSGAGSDAFLLKTTKLLPKIQQYRKSHGLLVSDWIERKSNISYPQYLKQTQRI